MVVSLYVCRIPENVTKEDLRNTFNEIDGFKEIRIKIIDKKGKIAFIDFENESNANFAMKILNGFKFSNEDEGLLIKISDNSKSKTKEQKKEYKNLNKKTKRENYNIQNLSSSSYNNQNQNKILENNKIESLFNNINLNNNLQLLFNNLKNFNNLNSNGLYNNYDSLKTYENKFKELLKNKKSNISNIVYVEGIPIDATEREVSHIFRPFPGFKKLRLIPKEKNGVKSFICFVDFEDSIQSTICIDTLQGYRFNKFDVVGLHFSYGIKKK